MTEAMFMLYSCATELHLFMIYWNCHTPFDLDFKFAICPCSKMLLMLFCPFLQQTKSEFTCSAAKDD